MTHIHKYRLPIKYRHPNGVRNLLLIVGILLAIYGLWWSVTSARAGYQLYTHANERVMTANMRADRAMADVILAMRMMEGKVPVMTAGGLRVAKIEWQDVKLVRGLR